MRESLLRTERPIRGGSVTESAGVAGGKSAGSGRRHLMGTPPSHPTLKGSSIPGGMCDVALMRLFQGRMERVLGLPWAASRHGGTCPRLSSGSLSGCVRIRR